MARTKQVENSSKTSIQQAADAIRDLVRSVSTAAEQKVAFEHRIDSLSREAEYLLDEIEMIQKASRKKVLLAYRTFLSRQLEAVDKKIRERGR